MFRSIFLTASAAAVLAATLTAPVAANNARPLSAQMNPGTSFQLNPGIRLPVSMRYNCVVMGSPSEFPDDIRVWNPLAATAAGTVISWSFDGSTAQGTAVLPALAAGQVHSLQNVLAGGMEAGTACRAVAITS